MTSAVNELPADWVTKTLDDLGRIVRGGSPRPAGDPRYFNGSFIPWLTVSSLTAIPASQISVKETAGYLTEEGAKRSRTLLPNTVVLANSGATLGVAKLLDLKCCANDGIAALIDQHSGDKEFICQYLNTRTEYLRDVIAPGNGQPNLNTSLIKAIEVPFPPDAEQARIAEALRNADDLMTVLVRLIAKKRDIRQGMMQELLTGRARLHGATGPWEPLHVAATSHIKARIGWQGLTTQEYRDSGEYRLVGGTDFRNGRVDWARTPFVDKWRYDQDANIQVQAGDVLLTKDGTIGKTAFVDSVPGPATLNSGVFVLRPKRDAYDPEFLYWMLRSRVFERFVAGLSAGSTISHLYQRDLMTLELEVPPTLDEQRAIARALSDAEGEITALARQLEAARDVKIGMMQDLFSGRTRLHEESAS